MDLYHMAVPRYGLRHHHFAIARRVVVRYRATLNGHLSRAAQGCAQAWRASDHRLQGQPAPALHGEVQRIVVDSQDVLQIIEPYSFSPTSDDGTGRLGLTRIGVTVAVPTGAAIGPARYQAILTYQCNPLQRALGHAIEVRSPSVSFEILPDDGPAIYRGPAQDPDVIAPSNRRDAQIRHPVFLSALASATSLRADCFANACPLGMVRVRTHFRRADGRLMRVREHCRSPPTSRY